MTPTSYRYTGQREEAGLGLYYYGARWYDPALGHFIGCPLGADTIVPQPGNVLDYHRYSYTRFNPLKYTDPTGHCVATAASVAGALVSGGGSLALSPSSLAFDAACWAALYTMIQVSNHLADNPPAFPELQLPGGNESYPLTVAEPQIYAQPVGSDLEVGVTLQGISADSTLQIGNVLADPLPGIDPTGHIYASWLGTNVTIVGTKSTPRLRGYQEAVSELTGGLASAQSLYENLTGGQPDVSNLSSLAPTNVFIQPGKIEVRFRPSSASGTPVIEVVNHADKTYEKIHFVE